MEKAAVAPALAKLAAAQAQEEVITADDLSPGEDRIVVRQITVDHVGKLHLAEPQKTPFAKVLAVGPGRLLDNGLRGPMRTKVGQTILLPYGTQQTRLGDDTVIIIREVDVTCHVDRKPKALPKAEGHEGCCKAPSAPTT